MFLPEGLLVVDGHQAETPASVLTYASIVSGETVHIALTLVRLNDSQVTQVMYRTHT